MEKPIEVAVADLQDAVKRLRGWKNFFVAIFVLGMVFVVGPWMLADQLTSMRQVRTVREGDVVYFSTSNDGPFLIPALAAYGDGESEKRVAPLPTPVVVIDSNGGHVNLKGLRWYDIQGQPAEVPNGEISALVVYPLQARPRSD